MPGRATKRGTKHGDLSAILAARFERHMDRHPGMEWGLVMARLEGRPGKLRSLLAMEETGGEPDVIGRDDVTGEYLFVDCSAETPKGRTGLCYDRAGLDSRKEHKPGNSALDLAAAMGIEMLDEERYRALQRLGEFDLKTSSWLLTPPDVRSLGGALFGDRRFGRVFVYHNGAGSYFGARGFRGILRL
jgi:hypothetical protein